MKEANMTVTPYMIDRAHRIGPVYQIDGNRYQSIIAKFTNFRTRTEFYQKRKKIKEKVKLRIDLTKKNYNLLKEMNQLIYDMKLTDVYVFTDINCRIKIVDKSSDENCFANCIEDFENFISHSSANSAE